MTEEQEEKLNFYIQELVPNKKFLNDWERGFLDDQIKRHEQYGPDTRLSVKQWAVLEKMYRKVTEDVGQSSGMPETPF